MNACAVCKAPSDKKCSLCQKTFYCSKEHQKLDWKKHKGKCTCFKVEENEALGRFMVATRSIHPGEEILREKPLVSGPPECTPPVCLGCYRLLTELSSVECPKCGWPMCSTACAKSPQHFPECQITANVKGTKVKIQTFQIPHPSYSSIVVLRCLYLKNNQPTLWGKLTGLQSHCEERKACGKYEHERTTIAQFIPRFFKLTDFSEDEILKVNGIINVNGHEVPISGNTFVSIYETASFLEHNCQANCSKGFSAVGELVVRAARTISAGEHLSICYTDPLWGTINRREHLLETKYFQCTCDRCKDATEFGTNFNSLLCKSSGCKGFLVPDNAIRVDSVWKCSRCTATFSPEEINSIITTINSRLSSLDKSSVRAYKAFIKEHTEILHSNHFLITNAKMSITDILDEGVSSMSDDDLLLKMTYCRQLVKLTKTLVPAENRCIGVLLFGLHAALAEIGRRKSNNGEMDQDDLRNSLLECRDFLAESYNLLKHEPDILPEGQIALQAKTNLKDIDKILQALHGQMGDAMP